MSAFNAVSNLNKNLPYQFAKLQGIVAYKQEENSIFLYHLAAELDLRTLAEIRRFFNCPITLQRVSEQEFQQYLAQIYQAQSSILDAAETMEEDMDLTLLVDQIPNSEDLLDNQDEAPVIRLINALFTQAIKQKASDIHIETYEDKVLVRNRIDGILSKVLEIQRNIAPLLISRVKVMAKLDIAERRIPQDGRISLRIGGHNIDVRVSVLPSSYSERIVLRILDKQAAQLNLNLLGMNAATLKLSRTIAAEPHGIILITGPTGSGKTTSLYAILTELNQISKNILTIEDPIEYDLPGIGQTQVNTKVNMTFAKGLRAILRQDPDIVMVGEIRDLETADIAVQASLTGHLVLSTLHTNSALGAITRLHDMGIESFLLASSLIGLIAQRLVRKLCTHCKTAYYLSTEEQEIIHFTVPTCEIKQVYQANGCEHCNYLGYNGRMGIYEVIKVDDNIRSMIHRNEDEQVINRYLRPGIPTIRADGFKRVLAGETTLAEILRVTSQN